MGQAAILLRTQVDVESVDVADAVVNVNEVRQLQALESLEGPHVARPEGAFFVGVARYWLQKFEDDVVWYLARAR